MYLNKEVYSFHLLCFTLDLPFTLALKLLGITLCEVSSLSLAVLLNRRSLLV